MLPEESEDLSEVTSTGRHNESSSINCRICYEHVDSSNPATPCFCKGSSGHVHIACLEKWLSESNTNMCDVCQFVFETERTPKYRAIESLLKYFNRQPIDMGFRIRDLKNDLAIVTVFTPISFMLLYASLLAADYYSQEKFVRIPTILWWSSSSILVVVSLLFFSYSMWLYAIVRYHRKVWFYWWQRETIVHIKLPLEIAASTTVVEVAKATGSTVVGPSSSTEVQSHDTTTSDDITSIAKTFQVSAC